MLAEIDTIGGISSTVDISILGDQIDKSTAIAVESPHRGINLEHISSLDDRHPA